MKKITLLIIGLLFITGTPMLAESGSQDTMNNSHARGQILRVRVHGMVCDFCVSSVKKRFMKQKAVKDVAVNLDTMTVIIEQFPGKQLKLSTIKKQVKKAGYKYIGIVKRGKK